MSKADPPDLEDILRAEVDRAVAPYAGRLSRPMLDKMRRTAERYYREHPQAIRVLQLMKHEQQLISGTVALDPEAEKAATRATGTRKA